MKCLCSYSSLWTWHQQLLSYKLLVQFLSNSNHTGNILHFYVVQGLTVIQTDGGRSQFTRKTLLGIYITIMPRSFQSLTKVPSHQTKWIKNPKQIGFSTKSSWLSDHLNIFIRMKKGLTWLPLFAAFWLLI